jgi:hypothetical protein
MPRSHRILLTLAATLLAAAGAAPHSARAEGPQEGLRFFDTGPLRIREQFLLGQGFLAFEPVSADLLERGQWQVDLVQNATNTWVHSDQVDDLLEQRSERAPVTFTQLRALDPGEGKGLYFADGELNRTSVSVRRGLGRGLQLSVTVPWLDFGGGFGDATIEGFHDTFGFTQSGRTGTARDSYTVYLRNPSGEEVFRQSAPSGGIGDVSVGLKAKLPTPSPAWQLALESDLKLPTGDEERLYGTGAVDVGTELLATRYFARSCIHAGLGLAFLGANHTLSTDDQLVVSAMLAYEHALGAAASVILQATAAQSPFRELEIQGLDENAHLVDLGLKKGFGNRWVGFMAVSENLLQFGSTADVGLHFGATYTR